MPERKFLANCSIPKVSGLVYIYLKGKSMVLDLKSEREQLAKRILLVEDTQILAQIQFLIDLSLETESGDESPDEYNAEIDQAIEDMKKGLGIPHESLKNERRNW